MKILELIRQSYEQSGYVRVKMDHRRGGVRSGWELRVPFDTPVDAQRAAKFLSANGIKCGSPFVKRASVVVPIYGRTGCELFFEVVKPTVKAEIEQRPKARDLRFKRKKGR